MKIYDYLIVGGGMVADSAAKGIRSADSSGSICIVGQEPYQPYKRPPLTKKLWFGKPVSITELGTAQTQADILTSRTVVKIDPEKHQVVDSDGQVFGYQKLLLATGGTPRHFPFEDPEVIYYRTLADYYRLRELTAEGGHCAVVGGGFIGSELAAALRQAGMEVTLVVAEKSICARLFPDDVAQYLNHYYSDKGINVILNDTVTAVHRSDNTSRLQLASGQSVEADIVVAGIGITPNVQLAQEAGLEVSNGIVTDRYLQTSAPDIYAVGDCAAFVHPVSGKLTRVEHEDHAIQGGKAAGLAMAGQAQPYNHLPMFYSDMFELGYEAVGSLDSKYQVIYDWQERFAKGVLYYVDSNRVKGVLNWNVWDKVDQARELIMSESEVDYSSLSGIIDMD